MPRKKPKKASLLWFSKLQVATKPGVYGPAIGQSEEDKVWINKRSCEYNGDWLVHLKAQELARYWEILDDLDD